MAVRFPPGPAGGLWGWSLISRLRRDPLKLLSQLAGSYGDLSSFAAGPFHLVFVNHPDLVREVLVTKHKAFRKDPRLVRLLRQIDGEGLINSEGEFWLRQRRLVQPAFAPARLAGYARVVVDFADQLGQSWQAGAELDIDQAMTHLTLRIIAKTLFDVELTGQAAHLGEAVAVVSETIQREAGQIVRWPDWLPTRAKRRKRWAIRTLQGLIEGIVRQRRQSPGEQGDLLAMLLAATDIEGDGKGMSDVQVRDEAMTLFNAGHDSTAAALAWTWAMLAQHPDIQLRAATEARQMLGDRAATFDDLPALNFTTAVVKESIRLYPPTWLMMARQVVQPVELSGYCLPAGTLVYISPWMIHHDARFFPDPWRFDPERFVSDRAATIPQYAWIPFGGGPHVCIGNTFATMEMVLVLATLLRRWSVRLAPQQGPLVPEPRIAIRPRGGVKAVLASR